MLEKLAIWYLEKRNVSVILNCEFNKPISIKTKDKVIHSGNHYINGTKFQFKDGNSFEFRKVEELEE